MKTTLAMASRLIPVLLFVCVGCSSKHHRLVHHPKAAIAVTTNAGISPTTEQVALIHQAMRAELSRIGLSLANKGEAADFIVTVSFAPLPAATVGGVTIVAIEPIRQFRDAASGMETPEMKEMRERQEAYQRWVDRDSNRPL